jgi:hypothetical protein
MVNLLIAFTYNSVPLLEVEAALRHLAKQPVMLRKRLGKFRSPSSPSHRRCRTNFALWVPSK